MNTLVDRALAALFRDGFILVDDGKRCGDSFPLRKTRGWLVALGSKLTTSRFHRSDFTGLTSTKTFRFAVSRTSDYGQRPR
jgi:hypothetical protein